MWNINTVKLSGKYENIFHTPSGEFMSLHKELLPVHKEKTKLHNEQKVSPSKVLLRLFSWALFYP